MRTKFLGRLMACVVLAAVPLMISTFSNAQAPPPRPAPIMPPGIPPTHVVDLMTTVGAAALGAQWKVSDVKIVEVPAIQGAMPQYKTTYSIEPQAGGSDFDDSKWPNIEPKDLAARRSGGHVAFMWYRTPLTIPAKIGDFDPSGAVVVLTVTVDDYAEVMEWSGRAPYLTGEWRWEGTLKEHCHVQPIQCDRCHDGHRYRQEFVPCRRSRSARRDRAAAEMVTGPSGGTARQQCHRA
jgi:hypothetical protein